MDLNKDARSWPNEAVCKDQTKNISKVIFISYLLMTFVKAEDKIIACNIIGLCFV